MNKQTPIIIREDEKGIVGIFPTLPGHVTNRKLCQLYQRGTFEGSETYESFMERTSEASASDIRKFIKKLGDGYRVIEKATPAMHRQREGALNSNPDML